MFVSLGSPFAGETKWMSKTLPVGGQRTRNSASPSGTATAGGRNNAPNDRTAALLVQHVSNARFGCGRGSPRFSSWEMIGQAQCCALIY